MIDQTLAHYKILKKIGSGGMGDVYLAEDTKLDRKVALKVLPPHLAENEERRSRFQREAKALAALDHPNIVQVFSVEEAEGNHFITMQLVQGRTLTELIPTRGFVLNKFFEVTIPLADAVAAAHQAGITHRDLKPDNVMVSDDGRVTVLDFGLAKPTPGLATEGSELETQAKTAEGTIVGTLHYMSPEQTQGKTVDARSDIFSLGIMFYEMLTGRRPFTGETPAEVLSSINKDAPPSVTESRPRLPRALSRIVQRCLVKDPTRRAQSALDVRNELEELKADLGSGELEETIPQGGRNRINTWFALVTAMLSVALAATWVYIARAPEKTAPRLTNHIQVTSAVGVENYPTWSPDGGRLAYESDQSGNWDIWVTQLGGGAAANLTPDHAGEDRFPSWSPDGREIAFYSKRNQIWNLHIMPAVGGSPRKVISLPHMPNTGGILGAPQWSADGSEVVFAARNASSGNFAQVVSLRTLEARQVPLPAGTGNPCLDLSWSPDGRMFAYIDAITHNSEVTRLRTVPYSGGEPVAVTDGRSKDWNPTWSADGRTLFFVSNRGGSMDLWQQRMSQDGTPGGDAKPVTSGLGIRAAALSPDGTKLVYSKGRRDVSNVWRVPMLRDRPATWDDAVQITFDNATAEFFDVMHGGDRLIVSSDRVGNQDLWTLPSQGGEMTQLTTDPTPDWHPRWSPDGTEIVFYAHRSGNRDIWVMPAEGGPARQLTFHPASDAYPAWSPDGQQIAFTSQRSGNRDVWIVAAKGGEPRQVTIHLADDQYPFWSPDGEWLLFERRDEPGSLWRVPPAGGEPQRLIAAAGGMGNRFSPDGKVVYFSGRGERRGNLWAASLEERREYPVTDLAGRYGRMFPNLATDGEYAYFPWQEHQGDIWVTDVLTDEEK